MMLQLPGIFNNKCLVPDFWGGQSLLQNKGNPNHQGSAGSAKHQAAVEIQLGRLAGRNIRTHRKLGLVSKEAFSSSDSAAAM